jgi:RHS repeat-associated protein
MPRKPHAMEQIMAVLRSREVGIGNVTSVDFQNGTKDPGRDGESSTGEPHPRVGKDAFGMSFHYHEDDFARINGTNESPFNDNDASMLLVPDQAGTPKNTYSGLIGAWTHKTKTTGDANVLRDGALVGERFYHDKLGRLRADTTYVYNSGWQSDGDGGWGARFKLDPNSNMLRMERWSMTNATTSVKHDDATLALVSNQSNALKTIDDQGAGITGYDQELDNATAGDIDVDAKGRLTQQQLGTLANTTSYTSYDVPLSLTRGIAEVTYVRDAYGEVVRADVALSSTWLRSIYVIPGSVIADRAVYTFDGTEYGPDIQEWSIVGLSRLGVHRGTAATIIDEVNSRNVGHTRYELTDHLGSVRAVVSDIKLQVSSGLAADMLAVADYDPYGAVRSKRSLALSGEATYRHAFQGMRTLEAGAVGEYRTLFRLYHTMSGRWSQIDPILQPTVSSYEGLSSLPMSFIDPAGAVVDIYSNKGSYLFSLDDNKNDRSTLTFKELYRKKIQWFAPTADNYMPLIAIAPSFRSNTAVRHVEWKDVLKFSTKDRWPIDYRSGGSGDWKESDKGGDGYPLVDIGGYPFYGDAIGQLPFAIDTYHDKLKDLGDKNAAKSETISSGMKHGGGSIFGWNPDYSNSYDNYMIKIGVEFASENYIMSASPNGSFTVQDMQLSVDRFAAALTFGLKSLEYLYKAGAERIQQITNELKQQDKGGTGGTFSKD